MRYHQAEDPADSEWKDVGKGSMKVTREKGAAGAVPRILIRNTLGKITLNTNLYKGMKFEKAGKNGVKFTVLEVGSDKKVNLVATIVKCKVDQLDNMLSKLKSFVPA